MLFPFVGSLKDKKFTVDGTDYPMAYGTALQGIWSLSLCQTKDEAWFSLKSNDETLAKYPFEFVLEIGYKLSGSEIKVTWRVTNPAQDLLFSRGGYRHLCVRSQSRESSQTII